MNLASFVCTIICLVFLYNQNRNCKIRNKNTCGLAEVNCSALLTTPVIVIGDTLIPSKEQRRGKQLTLLI